MLRRISGLACGLALLATDAALGQTVVTETPAPAAAPAPAAVTVQPRRLSHILGSTVRLQGNNNFGKVEDVVLDNNGGIGYAVVSNNGRYAMLPWNAAQMNWGQRSVSWNVTPQAIQPLYFAPNAWPNLAENAYPARVTQVFPEGAVMRREVLRPAPGTAPVVPAPGVVKEKVRTRGDGTVIIKDKVK